MGHSRGADDDDVQRVAKIGGLEVQLTWFRGFDECGSSAWTPDADELARAMRKITCEAGHTKIGKVFKRIREEHAREKVSAAVLIGDACEEVPQQLYDAAAGLGVPVFLFQEGAALAMPVDRLGWPIGNASPQTVEQVFRELARLTGGAYARFDAGAAATLGELLRAVAAFCVGGAQALANQHTDSARKLLGQMKQGT